MRKNEKVKYEIDPFASGVPKFRHLLEGTFKIDKDNTLIYQVKSPQASSIPQQLKLSGNWSLNSEHNLVLTLDKENNQLAKDKFTLKGEIIGAKADKLEFAVTTKDVDGSVHFYILQFGGAWQADRYNRLSFLVRKENSPDDILTLSGSWEINKQNQIIYTYIEKGLKTKEKSIHTLTFKGFWDINEKSRISYVLNKELNSCFDFKVSLGKPAKRGLEYEIGIGAAPKKKKLTLFGAWKLNEKIGLIFEMPSEEGKLRRIVFGATCKLKNACNLEFRLRNALQKDLGIDVKLAKTILKDKGEAYFEALKEGKELSIFAGAGFRW